ncbi:molybdopterin dinucleotide binding domain-containing protein [Spongisporangium articulatum]|uniref:Molybdopterin dinucleotide binding domain-containing protein n=1 Tax=Spongisporangium articulatum TaxID=3362603 RepID=A0ABW8AJJ9_9ACTN
MGETTAAAPGGVEHSGPAERPDREYPYLLTTGGGMQPDHGGAQIHRVASPTHAQRHAFAELHPDLAGREGVAHHGLVRLTTRRGSAVFRARLTDAVRPDTVFAPAHWEDASSVDALTDRAPERFSRIRAPEVCAVAVTPIEPSDDDPSRELDPA